MDLKFKKELAHKFIVFFTMYKQKMKINFIEVYIIFENTEINSQASRYES